METKIIFEHTDTFGGESNYSWVRREEYTGKNKSDLAIVRAAKKFAGISGVRSRVESYGDMLAIYPAGICQVVFIMWV
jgi:hypothetical protein